MNIRTEPFRANGTVKAPSSKSDIHRILICAAFADRPTKLFAAGSVSDDIKATLRSLHALGADMKNISQGIYEIIPAKEIPSSAEIFCAESGSTLRFMLPVAAAVCKSPVFTVSGRLSSRPVSELLDVLAEHGKTNSGTSFPITLSGTLSGGDYRIPGNISSQYVSGLLMSFPLTGGKNSVTLTSPLSSKEYVGMTADTMARFGCPVTHTDNCFSCESTGYSGPSEITAEGDWSGSAFLLAAGALSGNVTVNGLKSDSHQPDRAIAGILRRYGAEVKQDENSITVSAGNRRAFDIDADGFPDLVPVLCILAAGAEGTSVIRGISRLRAKESDRVESCRMLIDSLGGRLTADGDKMMIRGSRFLRGGRVNSFNDHRIAMAAATAACICRQNVDITDAQCVAKSYPAFFSDIISLGGEGHVL